MASNGQVAVDTDAVIVGAGFSGLYMLHKLRDQMGLSSRVFEAAAGVGGTWYWNRYPGARSDSESYIYSFTFDEDLWQNWKWSERYPGQREILSYLEHVAERSTCTAISPSTPVSPPPLSTRPPAPGRLRPTAVRL
jgi:cation diffusion facilitator CzcD-associated flavoprotein CzcO